MAEEFIDAGDAVVVPVRIYARGHESGIGTSARAVQVYWFKDGRVVRYRLCESRADALEAVGLESDPASGLLQTTKPSAGWSPVPA